MLWKLLFCPPYRNESLFGLQDVWNQKENEDIDRAIALSLVEESEKTNNVHGE